MTDRIASSFDMALEERIAHGEPRALAARQVRGQARLVPHRERAELRDAIAFDRVLLKESTRESERRGAAKLETIAASKRRGSTGGRSSGASSSGGSRSRRCS